MTPCRSFLAIATTRGCSDSTTSCGEVGAVRSAAHGSGMRTSTSHLATDSRPSRLILEVAPPVDNQAAPRECSLRQLDADHSQRFRFSWRLAIVDNAPADDTLAIGRRLTRGCTVDRAAHWILTDPSVRSDR
jgi:hypothetical protein